MRKVVKAIKVGNLVLTTKDAYHIKILRDFQDQEGLTDDQIDKMIEDEHIKFGSAFLGEDGHWEYYDDETRNAVYSSLEEMIFINGDRD